jgi:hypothetical protein
MLKQKTTEKPLYKVRDLIAPVADINFFIELNDSGVNYDNDELASIIKANAYEGAKARLAEFSARKKDALNQFKSQNLDIRESELNQTEEDVRRSAPGKPPSSFWVDKDDQDAINRHNKQIDEFNNKLDLNRRCVDKRDKAKERYEDALVKYQEKRDEAEEQIREKAEELDPAMDQDIVAFLGKLQQLVYDCFHNKALLFEAFILLFMAKKAYVFLYDRIGNAKDRNSASAVFRQLNDELDNLIVNYSAQVRSGFSDIVMYVYDCFCENKAVFDSMQENLRGLPYDICDANTSTGYSLVSLAIDTSFQYKDIIDPNELARMEGCIRERHASFQQGTASINGFLANYNNTFDSIAEVLADSRAKSAVIHQNKQDWLGDSFDYSRFALGVFDENIQDAYLKQQRSLLEAMQLEIESAIGMNLTELVRTILETELLTLSAKQAIETNACFEFLEYRQKLQNKLRELAQSVTTIDAQLADIARQPEEKSAEFSKKTKLFLGLSIFPLGNLATMFPLHQTIEKFLPALASNNSTYVQTRHETKSKLQGFLIAHAVIAVLIGGATLAVKEDQKPITLGAAGSYGLSASLLFLKSKKLNDL